MILDICRYTSLYAAITSLCVALCRYMSLYAAICLYMSVHVHAKELIRKLFGLKAFSLAAQKTLFNQQLFNLVPKREEREMKKK